MYLQSPVLENIIITKRLEWNQNIKYLKNFVLKVGKKELYILNTLGTIKYYQLLNGKSDLLK